MTRGTRYARRWLLGCLLALAAGAVSAQGYPSRPIRFIVSFSAGSGTDTIARIVASGMSQAFGQQVVVENRGGAAGNIGAEIASRAAPDGYTMFLVNLAHAANATLYRKLPYNLFRDFAPVVQLATIPSMIAVHPSLPAGTIAELVKLAKARPGAIDFSSGGVGTASFLSAELFKAATGVNLRHVPYKSGAEALTAVITGEVPIFFAPLSTSVPLLRQGRVRGLGVTSLKRLPILPDMPTVAESGYPGFQAGNWYGLLVPAKTPGETIARINRAALAALGNPDVSRRLTGLGFIILGDRPEDFAAFMKSEVDGIGRVLRQLGISL